MAFVAPKIIGGITAPSPVGELGFVEMTQAMNLSDVSYETVSAGDGLTRKARRFIMYFARFAVNGHYHTVTSPSPHCRAAMHFLNRNGPERCCAQKVARMQNP